VSEELLTPEEAAQRLKVGRTKIYELMERKQLRSITIDRCRRIPESEIAAFIQRKLGEEAAHA
jgi:excisionase family DNA binding protein